MCGIAGIVQLRADGPRPDMAVLDRMTDALVHRGPDGRGVWADGPAALGHRRLSIIDLDNGQQPFSTPDGRVTVSFNGEIYNFRELSAELTALGYAFRTRCDTEVIVHAWSQWGPACVDRFRGMFAFALWDSDRQQLFLARDRLGIKPLHYAELADGSLIFGSELKALMAHPGLARRLDPRAVALFFALGYVPDPFAILTGVRKLEAGHRLLVRPGKPLAEPERYWDLDFRSPNAADADALVPELRRRLEEAVRYRLIADVPLGAFLSGGVDSSSVVAVMAGLLQPDPVNSCSIGFDVPAYDESRYAAQVAEQFGTAHRSRLVDPDDFELAARLGQVFDEPFADASALPTYRVCELARETVTVALSGDGGDELFAGYRRQRFHLAEERVRGRLPLGLRRALFAPLGRLYPKLDWAPQFLRAKTSLQALGRDSAAAYCASVSILPPDACAALFSPGLKAALDGFSAETLYRDVMAAAPAEDALSQAQYADVKIWLPGDILTKVDRTSMAHSLEVRVPLLDHVFAEWAARVPAALRLKGEDGKWLYKKAFEGTLSDDILYRRKMGFSVPLADWFRGDLAEACRALTRSERLAGSGILSMDRVAWLVDRHQSGARDHARVLWALMMFDQSLAQTGAAL